MPLRQHVPMALVVFFFRLHIRVTPMLEQQLVRLQEHLHIMVHFQRPLPYQKHQTVGPQRLLFQAGLMEAQPPHRKERQHIVGR